MATNASIPRQIFVVRACGCIAYTKADGLVDDEVPSTPCLQHRDAASADLVRAIISELAARRYHTMPIRRAAIMQSEPVGIEHPCGCKVAVAPYRSPPNGRRPTGQYELCDRHTMMNTSHAERVTLFSMTCHQCCVMLCSVGTTAWEPHLALCDGHAVPDCDAERQWILACRVLENAAAVPK